MTANTKQAEMLFGKIIEEKMTMARCACVACNSCTCACSCRRSPENEEFGWDD